MNTDENIIELAKESLPKWCPDCKMNEGRTWTEFRVAVTEFFFVDNGTVASAKTSVPVVKVICTRCGAQMTEDDVKRCE